MLMSFIIKFTIPSDTRYIAFLRELVETVALLLGRKKFPKGAEFKCKLALIEAVDNAIFHAHKHCKNEPIDVKLSVGNDLIKMSVYDKGRGFRQKKLPVPEIMASHGRGLYLIKQLMFKVRSRCIQGGHVMDMTYKVRV